MAGINVNKLNVDHKIYENDPLEQRRLIENVVEITRVDGKKICGTVFTVDPVSESVVLVNEQGGKISMDIVMGHAVKSLETLPNEVPCSLEGLYPTSNPASSMSEETVLQLRSQLKEWLTKNFLPVVEDGDVLSIGDALKILPPYTADQCISDNEIILGKVQELISKMPKNS